jgi:hypothetical protein
MVITRYKGYIDFIKKQRVYLNLIVFNSMSIMLNHYNII